MASPEFSPKLDLSQAQEYRRGEAHALRNARNSGLGDEAREYRGVLHNDPLYKGAQTLAMQRRWEHLAQNIPEFSQEDWERAGRVFSGINNGVKAALFVDIAQNTRPGTYMSVDDIAARFKDLFAGTQLLEALEGKRDNTRAQVVKYCQLSLCDVGVLTADYTLAGEPIGFGVTQEGIESGLPHALRLLEWENTMKESAYPILGITSSKGETRAPFNTARILDYLLRHPYNVKDPDLVDALGMNSINIFDALKRFDDYDLIDYKAVDSRTSKTPLEYAWDNTDLGQAPYITARHRIQDAVIQVIQQKGLNNPAPKFSIKEIAQRLPQKITRKWKTEKSLRGKISNILSGLANPEVGFLQRVNDFKGGEKQSDITLKQKGRSFFFRIILPALLNSSVQPLTTSLSQLAQTSAELYYPYSNSNKQREHQNNIKRVAQVIDKVPQTAQELSAIVKLSARVINGILRPHIEGSSEVVLEVDGQPVTIVRRKEKGVWYYSLKSPIVSNP